MIVRDATLQDVAAVAVLFDAYRIHYEQAPDLPGAAAFLADRIRNGESVIYLAEEGAELLGFVQLYPLFTSVGMQRAWLLNDLYVWEPHRNRGIGRALIDAAKSLARATGAKWIMLQTHSDNINAQALYEKTGFEKDDSYYYYYLSL
jgi:ribosomal protein S18 acetylase RimI-like enzyme